MIGRVYKVIVNTSNDIYVGSTKQELRHRWQDHRNHYKQNKEGKQNRGNNSIYKLFDKYGVENCKMILIKEYEVCDQKHLMVYEQLWINKLKPVNKCNPFRIKK
jgi:group I intron endonuclease